MAIIGNYLVLFPTPGGDKYHMFHFEDGCCSVENSIGPTKLENYSCTDSAFSGDMAAGPTTHHFEGVVSCPDITVSASVIDGADGKVINNYGGVLKPFDGPLPESPEAPQGHGGPGGPPPMPKA